MNRQADRIKPCSPAPDKTIDFVEEGFDLAIRLSMPQDSRLVALKLEDASLGVFATPAYLARKGLPRTNSRAGASFRVFCALPYV